MVKLRKRYFAIPFLLIFVYAMIRPEIIALFCNPYEEYDDAFSSAIFDGDPMVPAETIQEITFYELPPEMDLPCERTRKKMRLIRRITDKTTIEALVSAINNSSGRDSYGKSRVRMSNQLGIEIIANDQRKTFLIIWIFGDEIYVQPFPEKRFNYNSFFTFRKKLHSLLLEEGILDQLSGYAEFMAEQQGQ
ncbi:hypothetical protein [Desulfocurvus vexinensis]|uniref:hypothetical protein n=1 Tax=Desulfocurvus vexinensis TaxID=399548 RepID=UPI0012EC5176|nr:hypothetical protein [Desulfocurvus vexinensis]